MRFAQITTPSHLVLFFWGLFSTKYDLLSFINNIYVKIYLNHLWIPGPGEVKFSSIAKKWIKQPKLVHPIIPIITPIFMRIRKHYHFWKCFLKKLNLLNIFKKPFLLLSQAVTKWSWATILFSVLYGSDFFLKKHHLCFLILTAS